MASSGKSKIPLRGIGKLFTNLPPGVRAKLESAFVEAEQQINYHNNSVIQSQERRVKSSYVSSPVITLTQNSLGFDVSWERLNDRLISFYEAEVSLTNNFANPTKYTLTETSLSVEGVGSTVYVRVRGVRWDGDTGNWSNVVTMNSLTGGPITYSRGLHDVEPFYIKFPGNAQPGPIQFLRITPQRQSGGFLIFGSIGTLAFDVDDPAVQLTLNGVPISVVAQSDYPFSPGGTNFRSPGVGLGPVFVRHDQFYFGDQVSKPTVTITSAGTASSSGTHTDWTNANPSVYSITWGPGSGARAASTRLVRFTNAGFSVSGNNTIIGIQVDYTATDNVYGLGLYDEADLQSISLLDGGTPRASKVSGLPEWGNSAQSFGGSNDLWGESAGYWTSAKINDSGFGVELRGRAYVPAAGGTRTISATKPVITIYSLNETTGEVSIEIRYFGTSNDFYTPENQLTTCTLNAIEFGDAF